MPSPQNTEALGSFSTCFEAVQKAKSPAQRQKAIIIVQTPAIPARLSEVPVKNPLELLLPRQIFWLTKLQLQAFELVEVEP